MRAITKTANVESAYSLDIDEDDLPAGRKFMEIIDEGPTLGIYTVVWCDTYVNLSKMPYGTLDNFGYKIALRILESDVEKFLGDTFKTELKEKYALFKNMTGECRKFQPFQYPGTVWRSSFIKRITGRNLS